MSLDMKYVYLKGDNYNVMRASFEDDFHIFREVQQYIDITQTFEFLYVYH